MPRPTAIDAARRFRRELEAREVEAFSRMARIYENIFRAIQDEILALADEIAAKTDKVIDRQVLIDLARLRRLLDQVEQRVARFGGQTVTTELTLIQQDAIAQALANATELIELSLPPELPDELLQAIRGSFVTLPSEAIEAAAGLLEADSPLAVALERNYGAAVARQVEQHVLDGIGVGMNPRRIAILLNRNFTNSLGNGLTWAMTTVRTAQIKSYQLANHAVYEANPDLVPTWIWHSALDARTCMSCVSKHGQEFPVTETLRDHHRGRCAPIPKTITFADLGIPGVKERRTPEVKGEDYFKGLPKATQIEMMGAAKYRAWRAGEFRFSELSQPYDDGVYGELFREASLKDLLGKKAKQYYKAA